MTESPLSSWDMKMRLAADRVLRAIAHHTTPQRQAKVALLTSAALSVATAVEPNLPNDLIVLEKLLKVGAISALLKDVADGQAPSDAAIAARMEALLPLDRLDELVTGQHDLLRALTRQDSWRQQMLRLQEADITAGEALLTAFGEATGDLADIRRQLAAVATAEQLARLERLIMAVLPRLSESVRAKYNLSGDFRGANVIIESTLNIQPPEPPPPYVPPTPPAPDDLPAPGPLPPGSYVPYARNERFTGRGEQLLELAALLGQAPSPAGRGMGRGASTAAEAPSPNPSHKAGDQATPLVTISSGIGGVGKSALAVEFAYRYGRFFHGVHWVAAENPAAVDAAIAECGQRMGLHPTFGALPLPDQVALVERAWAGPEARLIIFDNLEDEALLARRPKSGGARLLATSRRERWDDPAARVRRLGPLSAPEGVRLLQRVLAEGEGRPKRTDVAAGDLRAIAAALGELPLALRLAGAYLRRYRRESAAGYLAALNRPDLLAHRSLDPGPGERGVARSFALSFDRLRPAEDAGDAAALALLARAACFAPGEPLPVELLLATLAAPDDATQPNDDQLTDDTAPDAPPATRPSPPAPLSSPSPWPLTPSPSPEDALERLLELGLLEDVDDSGEQVRLHRLLGVFIIAVIKGQVATAQVAVEQDAQALFDRVWESQDPRELRPVIVHMRHIVDEASKRDDKTALRLISDLGLCLGVSGDVTGMRLYFERALAICERISGLDHQDLATSLINLGASLRAQGDLAKAQTYYERALAINERVHGLNHLATAASMSSLGSLLQDQGDLTGARLYLERALAVSEYVQGPDHLTTALSLNNLGGLLQAQGDLDGAWSYCKRALAICERVLGPKHPHTATCLNNLGILMQARGELAGARLYLERALAIREEVLGPEHPDTAGSLDNFGGLLQHLGDLVEAQLYYVRALAVRENNLGLAHPDTALSLNNLGCLLRKQGDLAGAQLYFKRALAILQPKLGSEHLHTRTVRNNLAALPSPTEE